MNRASEICRFAAQISRRRGDVIFCLKDRKDSLLFINFPDRISTIPNCIATIMFSTGHTTPDCRVDVVRMYDCKEKATLQKARKKKTASLG